MAYIMRLHWEYLSWGGREVSFPFETCDVEHTQLKSKGTAVVKLHYYSIVCSDLARLALWCCTILLLQ